MSNQFVRRIKFRVIPVQALSSLALMAANPSVDMSSLMRLPLAFFSARAAVKNVWPRFRTRLVCLLELLKLG